MYLFLYENIIYFLSALIQIRLDVSKLLTSLSSLLRVNVNFRAFSSANEIDREHCHLQVDREHCHVQVDRDHCHLQVDREHCHLLVDREHCHVQVV